MIVINTYFNKYLNLKLGLAMLLCVFQLNLLAQISISYPTSRMVLQRDNANQTTVYIAGNYSQYIDSLQARFVARTITPVQGTTTAWATIQRNPTGGVFYGSMAVLGGWYDLEMKAYFAGQQVATTSVTRIGVGEVFVIAGQSNASGDNDLASVGNYGTGATDDRVSSVNFNRNATETYGGAVLPALPFSHLDYNTLVSPFGVGGWNWGALGDTLVQKLNVPIAFFNAAWSGSPLHAWAESANDPNATPAALFNFYTFPAGMPYGNLRLSLNFYAAQFGIRAVLWHQGESDNWEETSRNNYGSWLKNVIEKSREHSGKPNLTWVVARASRTKGFNATYSRIWQPVIDAQNDVSGVNGGSPNFSPHVVAGPQTDPLVGNGWRTMPDSIHFAGEGHRVHASAWASVLSNSFFATTTPYLAKPLPQISSNCFSTTQLTLGAVNSYANYVWTNNAQATWGIGAANNLTAGTGNYILRVKDADNNVLLSPSITVPASFTPIIPVTSRASGAWFDTNTWTCGRVPSAADNVVVNLGHTVIIPQNYQGFFAKLVLYGYLNFQSQATLSR